MRYMTPACPAAWGLMATLELPGRLRRAIAVLAVGVAVLFLGGAYRPVKPGWREYARVVDRAVRDGEIVAVTYGEGGARWAFQALLHYAWSPRRAYVVLAEQPTPASLEALRARGGCWLLTANQPGPDVLLPGSHVEERIEYPGGRSPMPLIWRLSFP
jgi:hypothetical protein